MGVILEKLFGRQQRSWSLRKPVRDWGDPWDDYGREVAGVTVTDRKVVGFPPIWRGLNIISDYFAKLKPELHRLSDREVDRTNPIRKMLRTRPNATMAGYTWRHTSAFHLKFYGNAYSLIERNRITNEPEALVLLDPSETVPFVTSGGELVYRVLVDGRQDFVDPDDMHHVMGLSVDGMVGLCMVELMAPHVGGHLAAVEWLNKYFENGTSASGILMVPGHLRKEAVQNAIKSWNEMATGVAKRGKVAVVQDNVKYEKLTDNAEHAQLLPVMEFGLLEASLMIGVPPHMVGSERNTSYSSLEEQNQAFLDGSLDGVLCAFEEEHNRKLLSEDEQETHYIEYNRDALLRAALEKRNQSYATGRQWGYRSLNDIMRAENLPLLPPALGDTYLMPTNMVAVDKDGNVVIGTPNTKPEGDPAPTDDNPPPGNETEDDPDEEPPPDEEQRSRLIGLLAERLQRVQKIELSKVRKLIGRGQKGFPEALESHYDDVYRLACLAWGEVRSVSDQSIDVTAILDDYCQARRHLIVRHTDGWIEGHPVPAVEELLQEWETRDLKNVVSRLLEGEIVE